MTYTGDALIKLNSATGEYDIEWTNGQPAMTDGLETCVLLAIFGGPGIHNGMTDDASEKYVSEFPAVIDRAKVNDDTRNNGTAALERALAFMVRENIASKITVTGQILSAYAIGWAVDISAPTGNTRYSINWEKGTLTAGILK
jgi:phage gp46-like protein